VRGKIRFTRKDGSLFDVALTNKTAIVFTRTNGTTFNVPLYPLYIEPKQIEVLATWNVLSRTITRLFAYNGTPPYTWSLVGASFVDYGDVWILGDRLHMECSTGYTGIPKICIGSVDVRVTDSIGQTADQTIDIYMDGTWVNQ
jgi:hypothetical protein